MVFPQTLGDFQRISLIHYNKTGTDTSGGYNASVGGKPVIMTLYVYDGLRAGLTGTAFQKECDTHFQSVKMQALGANPYRSTGDQPVILQKGGQAISGRYAEFAGGGRASRAYLFCNEGSPWLVKLRVTYTEGANVDKLLGDALNAMPWPTKALAKGTV